MRRQGKPKRVVARGRDVVVTRRGDRVKVAPRLRRRLRDRSLRSARFRVRTVQALLVHGPGLTRLEGWVAFDFGPDAPVHRIEFGLHRWPQFRRLVKCGWPQVVRG